MLKGFRDFILRGNIIELAVAVVIGTAFVALITQFTESFITPLIAVFTGPTEAEVLMEIRDPLRSQQRS